MSSLSSSAIHFGGELVMGCDVNTQQKSQYTTRYRFIDQAYILQYIKPI